MTHARTGARSNPGFWLAFFSAATIGAFLLVLAWQSEAGRNVILALWQGIVAVRDGVVIGVVELFRLLASLVPESWRFWA